MSNTQINTVEKMLRALLRKDNLIRWVGGYIYGRTSNDDPFIVLYPTQAYLKEKVVRVYENNFKKLPDFVDTAVPANTTNDGNPNKDKATRMGLYIECPAFEVLTYRGKETQMGPEIRFDDVLRITNSTKHYLQQPEQATAVPSNQPNQPPNSQLSTIAMWRLEAVNAKDPLMFDTAIVKMCPYFKDATTAEQFRDVLFPGGFDANHATGLVASMIAYADARDNNALHQQAKAKAYDEFRRVTGVEQVPQNLLEARIKT